MAVAGFKTRTYVKTTAGVPTASDMLNTNTNTDFNQTRAELETNYQGVDFSSLILGRKSCEPSIAMDYDPADSKFNLLTLMQDAHINDTALYLTVDFAGNGAGKQVGVKVSGIQIQSAQDGKVTFTPTLRSCTAVSDVTIV